MWSTSLLLCTAPFAHRAAAGCAGVVKQQITLNQQGDAWFTSITSERKAATSNLLPADLRYWAQESGTLSYGESRAGVVLSFSGCSAGNLTSPQAYLHLVWKASGPSDGSLGTPVLRVDATNCGTQRLDTGLYNQDCVVKNTDSNADSLCYCQPVPCVLKESAPAHTSWLLNASDAASVDVMLPVPDAYFGVSGLIVRITPLFSGNTAALSQAYTIIAAGVEYQPNSAPLPPVPKNTTARDNVCYGY